MSFHRSVALSGAACLAGLIAAQSAQAQAPQPDILTLEAAFARSMGDDPSVRAAAQAGVAADAAVRQADRRPNPTLDAMTENFGGSSYYQWGNRAETTFSLSQKLELGGDREARTKLAQRDAAAIRSGGELVRQQLLYEIELAYIDAQRAGAELEVAEARLALAQEIVATVDRRVEAARDPLMAGARSKTSLVDAQINVERARQANTAAKARLASYWLGAGDFVVDLASFVTVDAAPHSADPSTNPELARSMALQQRADAAIEVERARAKHDPTLSAGVRLFNDVDEAAFVVGVSIPLGIFDNNSAAIDRAGAQKQQARLETEALRRSLTREAASARSQLEIARSEIEALDARLLPSAEESVARAREGYEQGGFSYLDVLDAQRVLGDARLQRIAALHSFHRAHAALARLTGAYADAALSQETPR